MSELVSVGRIGCASATRPADDVELRRMRILGLVADSDIIDIGAGSGRLSLLLARGARSVLGVDPDAGAIREARRAARAAGARNVSFRVGPAQALGAADGSFDLALFSWSL